MRLSQKESGGKVKINLKETTLGFKQKDSFRRHVQAERCLLGLFSATCGWYICGKYRLHRGSLVENGFLDLGIRTTHKGQGLHRDKERYNNQRFFQKEKEFFISTSIPTVPLPKARKET